jgi:hypothetical protein
VSVLGFLRGFDAELVDGLLIRLAENGAEPGSIIVKSWPDGAFHGTHLVTWRQDGRNRSTEGHTALTALRRAVAASSTRSASRPSRSPVHNGNRNPRSTSRWPRA